MLIVSAASFAAGIAWASIGIDGLDRYYLTAGAILALAVFYLYRRRSPAAVFPLYLLFVLLGALHVQPALQPPTDPAHVYNLAAGRQEICLEGILRESPEINTDRSRLLMAVEKVRRPQGEAHRSRGLVQLTLRGMPPPDLHPGDRFLARTKVSPVHSYGTPGTFDYQKFLARQGIWLTGWINSPVYLLKLHVLPEPPFWHRLNYMPERLRHRLGLFLDEALPGPAAGVYKAILLGDRSRVPPRLLEQFKTTGTIHLLAISGLHMGLLAALAFGALGWLLKRSTRLLLHMPVWKITALLTILPLTAYALIAGFQTPVVRAWIMTCVFLLAILFDRQWKVTTNIAIAAWLILLWQPTQLYTVSFQLSFAAVTSIALILPRLKPLLSLPPGTSVPKRFNTRFLAAVALSVTATLGIFPLLILHFNRFSPVGPLATLVVEPFLCFWALPGGLLACLVLPFSPDLAALLLRGGAWGIAAADQLTAVLAALPFSSVWLPTPSLLQVSGFFGLLGTVYLWRPHWAVRTCAGCFLLLVVAPPLLCKTERLFARHAEVTFLDVGQGSSTLLEMPGGKAVLIDGGGYRSEQFDPGERVIAPFLWQKRITSLQGLVITHPHADHYNGLPFIIKRFHPEVIWTNGRPGRDPGYRQLQELAREMDIPVRVPEAGSLLFETGDTRLWNLAAFHHSPTGRSLSPNRSSLVLRLDGGHSFLFPGDIGRQEEQQLLHTDPAAVRVDVLLAAHHGSRTSNDPEFLRQASPRYLVISTGPYRPLPTVDYEQVSRGLRRGITPLDTAACGSIAFKTQGPHLQVETYRPCIPEGAIPL